MEKSLKQIALDYGEGRALAVGDRRAALFWFRSPSLYFPEETETGRSLRALQWLCGYVATHPGIRAEKETQGQCAVLFAREFSIPEDRARAALADYINEPSKRPFILGIEGLDGSGKTLQTKLLAQELERRGNAVRVIDFPQYSGFFGREIGDLLSGEKGVSALDLDEKSMCLWYALDRWKTLEGIRLEQYDYILFNRYTLSNVVYQSARRSGGFDLEFADWVFTLEHTQLRLPVPDLYLFLDAGTDRCGENVLRKGKRDYVKGLDVYESSGTLLDRCHGIYRELSRRIGEIRFLDCVGERGGLKSVEEIHGAVMDCLEEFRRPGGAAD